MRGGVLFASSLRCWLPFGAYSPVLLRYVTTQGTAGVSKYRRGRWVLVPAAPSTTGTGGGTGGAAAAARSQQLKASKLLSKLLQTWLIETNCTVLHIMSAGTVPQCCADYIIGSSRQAEQARPANGCAVAEGGEDTEHEPYVYECDGTDCNRCPGVHVRCDLGSARQVWATMLLHRKALRSTLGLQSTDPPVLLPYVLSGVGHVFEAQC